MSMILHGRQSWVARFLAVLAAIPLFAALNTSCTKNRNKYDDELFYKDVAWGIMAGHLQSESYRQADGHHRHNCCWTIRRRRSHHWNHELSSA